MTKITITARDLTAKSKDTPRLEATPHPLGTHGLWSTPSGDIPVKQKLPNYIEHIADALMKAGHPESQAIAMAIGAVKRWAKGKGSFGGKKQSPHPEVQAAAARAVAEWEALKASHHKKKPSEKRQLSAEDMQQAMTAWEHRDDYRY